MMPAAPAYRFDARLQANARLPDSFHFYGPVCPRKDEYFDRSHKLFPMP